MEKFENVDILLVEDNPNDAELAMRALRKGKLANHITWVKDGAEALEFIFRSGAYADRPDQNPKLIQVMWFASLPLRSARIASSASFGLSSTSRMSTFSNLFILFFLRQ